MSEEMEKPYCLTLMFSQSTSENPDNLVTMQEFSADPVVHAMKTQVMTRYLTQMVNDMTKELTDLSMAGGEPVASFVK